MSNINKIPVTNEKLARKLYARGEESGYWGCRKFRHKPPLEIFLNADVSALNELAEDLALYSAAKITQAELDKLGHDIDHISLCGF